MNSITGKWLHWVSTDDDPTVHLWLPENIFENLCDDGNLQREFASLERARSRDLPTIPPRE